MIALIPSIRESEGLTNLYLKNLAGKPVISYSIEAALNSKFIERIYVLTNSKEIAALAKTYDVDVLFQNLADLTVHNNIENIQKGDVNHTKDYIILEPAYPTRTAQDIDLAYDRFIEKNAGSLISCYEVKDFFSQNKKIINGKILDIYSSPLETKIENSEKVFLLNNSIFIFTYPYFELKGINYSEDSLPFIITDNHCFEIKTSFDFEFAEFLILKNNKEISSLKEIDTYKVHSDLSIRDSIKKLDTTGIGFIAITNKKNKILGIVTDGDFRRAVLAGVSMDDPIISISNKNFRFLKEGYSREELENIFFNNDIAQVPVIRNDELQEIILRKDIPYLKNAREENILKIPVAIMAGGTGTRLKPFTHVMPKPLIPIGNKPLIEIIIDRFQESGVSEFYLLLNYKANMIKAYFEGRSRAKNLHYITEEFPMGTAGALKKLKGTILSTFIVSNCDIIIKSDYRKIIDFHIKGKYDLTLVACMQHFKIPYGICSIEESGCLKEISEKPEFDYLVNTGMYILEPETLDYIPDNTFYHITHLIEELKKREKKVGVYPVYENSWIDVGQWEEYRKALKYLE